MGRLPLSWRCAFALAITPLVILLALPLTAGAQPASAQSVVERAKSLLRDGKPAEAFELLDPAADQLNDAESSYLHGIAALDSGKAGLAILSFERALAYDPAFAPARAELIRALIATGETDQARIELSRMSATPLPDDIRKKLAALGEALAEVADVARRRTRGISTYVEAEAGYDTNVNTGANSRTFAIPLFGGATATLDQIFQKHDSTFAGVGAGALAYYEVQPGLRLFAGIDAKGRYAFRKLVGENYHTMFWAASGGARWQRDGNTATVALTALENRVGGEKFDKQFGVYGQYQKQLDPYNEVGVFAQWLDQKHPIQRALDTELTLLGLSWRHAFQSEGLPVMTLAAYVGDDREQGADRAVGRDLKGIRLAYERQLEIGAKLVAAGTYQHSSYGGRNIFFNVFREDKRTDLSLALVFSPAKDVRVSPQYVYTQNRSNIPVVDFSRHQMFVNVRRDFQ